ncbi:MAG: hypothetical protein RXO27_04425 [Acidilobus sp.]
MKEGNDGEEPSLTELEKLILTHIYKYGPDSPWYMARRLMGASGWAPKYSEDEIERACSDLEARGYLTRFRGQLKREVTSSVKPWLKFKSREMGHKPSGIYYDLTKAGRRLASDIYKATRQEGQG